MACPLGIDLSPTACRIVELDRRARWRSNDRGTRVASFTVLQRDDARAAVGLAPFRGRRAAVLLWGPQSDHRQVSVSAGSYERMRAEARAHLRDAGLVMGGVLSDIAPISARASGTDRRAVMVASAPRAEVAAAVAPLEAAGLRIRSVLTPAGALLSLARLREAGPSETTDAYVALEETVTCIAIVRRRALLAARQIAWGYLDETADVRAPRRHEDIAARLADELAEFIGMYRFAAEPIAQVLVCGGLPELRSMTIPLMERLDIEVETLDSLFAIDASRLPEPADAFRERAAELRLAWAAAADRRPALDLFRPRRRRAATAMVSRAAVVAGAVTGLGVGWWLQNQWRPAGKPADGASPSARIEGSRPALMPPAVPLSRGADQQPPAVPVAPARRPSVSSPAPIQRVAPPQTASFPRPPAPKNKPPAVPQRRPLAAPRPRSGEDAALPFNASLDTILYGRERALAIVDGRIVQPGDDVRGARVVEITATAVLLRDAQGRLRRLSIGADR